MPVTTAYTDVFDVIKYGDGFLVRYPSAEKPNELTNYKSNKSYYLLWKSMKIFTEYFK